MPTGDGAGQKGWRLDIPQLFLVTYRHNGAGLKGERTDRFTCTVSQQPVGRHFCHSENKAVKHLSLPDKQTVAPSSAVCETMENADEFELTVSRLPHGAFNRFFSLKTEICTMTS